MWGATVHSSSSNAVNDAQSSVEPVEDRGPPRVREVALEALARGIGEPRVVVAGQLGTGGVAHVLRAVDQERRRGIGWVRSTSRA